MTRIIAEEPELPGILMIDESKNSSLLTIAELRSV